MAASWAGSSVAHQPAEGGEREPAGRARPGAAATIHGVQLPSRPRWRKTLFSSTKLTPSMMPPKTFRLTPPERALQVGEGQGQADHHQAGERVERALPELDLLQLRRLLVVGEVADVAPELDRRHRRHRQHRGGDDLGRERARQSSARAAPAGRSSATPASRQRVSVDVRERPACRRAATLASAALVRAEQPAVGVELEDAHARAAPSRRSAEPTLIE